MKSLLTLTALIISLTASSQFEDLVIVKVNNGKKIEGDTYQFYAQLKNEEDHIHIIFGDEYNTLSIETTAPFYQNELCGALSTNINPNVVKYDKKVKFDSFFTIGRSNSKANSLANFNIDFSGFEERGEGFTTDNGAWYVTPDQDQAYCKEGNRFIMIMQLTTSGEVTGNLNLQGMDSDKNTWRELDRKFSTENAISKKKFDKMKKKITKAYFKELVKESNNKEKEAEKTKKVEPALKD